jgi:hypothetical protein
MEHSQLASMYQGERFVITSIIEHIVMGNFHASALPKAYWMKVEYDQE